MKKAISAFLVLCLTAVCFSSCGYRISIEKKDKETTTAEGENTSSGQVTYPDNSPDTTQAETTTLAPTPGEYTLVSNDVAKVLQLYTSAVNDVKSVNPGFRKKENQETLNVTAGSGKTQLANNILSLVATEVLNGSDGKSNAVIYPGNSSFVKSVFPLFGKEKGCTLTETGIIKSAECYSDGTSYKIEIELYDAINPDENSDFAKIMNPADVSGIKNGIREYLVVLDVSQYKFDMNYTGCKITCIIDSSTNRMTKLIHEMSIDTEININLDLIVIQTKSVKCSGTIVDTVEYTDFIW